MSGLFGGGQTINQEETRVGALRIQNSTQGIPVPICYGMVRMTSNLLDYRGFNAQPVTTSQEQGKGGGGVTTNTTTYNYFVAPIMGLCEGPLPVGRPMVSRVWVDKVLSSGANLGFAEFVGSYNQNVWEYMTTNYPADGRALRGQAYLAHNNWQLGPGAGLQNMTFEVRARLWEDDCEADVNVARVLPDLLSNGNYGLGFTAIGDLTDFRNYCDAAGFRVSPCYVAQRPAAELVSELTKVANSAPFWSEGLLKVVPYADQPISRVTSQSSLTDEFRERWENGLADYVPFDANASLVFSVIDAGTLGNQVTAASYVGGNSTSMTRTLGETHPFDFLSIMMVRSGPGLDDGIGLGIGNVGINIAREIFFDPLQRPFVNIDGETQFINATILPENVVMSLEMDFTPGLGNSTWTLSYAGNGVVANSGNFFGSYPNGTFNFSQIGLGVEGSGIATVPGGFLDLYTSFGNGECVTGNVVSYTPSLTVRYDLSTANGDFIAPVGDPPITIGRQRQSDTYNVIQVSCLDRQSNYNKLVVEASDLDMVERFGRRVAPVIQAEMICEADVARAVAQTALQRAVYLRNTYQFAVGLRFARLEPMDIVTLTDPNTHLDGQVVRIIAVTEGDDEQVIELEAEDVLVGVGTPGQYPQQGGSGYVVNSGVDPGNANGVVIFQPPVELSGVAQVWVGASGGADWGGAEIWASDDGSSYARIGVITSRARTGVVTQNWPASADPDTTGNLHISLANGVLTSATQLEANALDTMSWVGAANTPGELIAYSNALLTGPNAYRLDTYIRRGLFCGFAATHLIGEQFMRIDAAVVKLPVEAARVGETVYYKLRSFNTTGGGLQNLALLEAQTYVIQPIGLTIVNGVVPSTINAGQVLCVPEEAQYSVQSRMNNYGRINLHGRLIIY